MLIIGCDFHTRYQQIAMAEDGTGELTVERRLDHESGEAEAFYRSLQGPIRVGLLCVCFVSLDAPSTQTHHRPQRPPLYYLHLLPAPQIPGFAA